MEEKELVESRKLQVIEAIQNFPNPVEMAELAEEKEEEVALRKVRVELEAKVRLLNYFSSLIKRQSEKGYHKITLVRVENSWNLPPTEDVSGTHIFVINKNIEEYSDLLEEVLMKLSVLGYTVNFKENEYFEIIWAKETEEGHRCFNKFATDAGKLKQ